MQVISPKTNQNNCFSPSYLISQVFSIKIKALLKCYTMANVGGPTTLYHFREDLTLTTGIVEAMEV